MQKNTISMLIVSLALVSLTGCCTLPDPLGTPPPCVPPAPDDSRVRISSTWTNGTGPVVPILRWELPSGEIIQPVEGFDLFDIVGPFGTTSISEPASRVKNGIHRIEWRLVDRLVLSVGGDNYSNDFADVNFGVSLLGYEFSHDERLRSGSARTIELEVNGETVTEMANSWR